MSSFLQMQARRLPVALADYVSETGEDEVQRRAIAGRIIAALPSDQQAEISRMYETMKASARRTDGASGPA